MQPQLLSIPPLSSHPPSFSSAPIDKCSVNYNLNLSALSLSLSLTRYGSYFAQFPGKTTPNPSCWGVEFYIDARCVSLAKRGRETHFSIAISLSRAQNRDDKISKGCCVYVVPCARNCFQHTVSPRKEQRGMQGLEWDSNGMTAVVPKQQL